MRASCAKFMTRKSWASEQPVCQVLVLERLFFAYQSALHSDPLFEKGNAGLGKRIYTTRVYQHRAKNGY